MKQTARHIFIDIYAYSYSGAKHLVRSRIRGHILPRCLKEYQIFRLLFRHVSIDQGQEKRCWWFLKIFWASSDFKLNFMWLMQKPLQQTLVVGDFLQIFFPSLQYHCWFVCSSTLIYLIIFPLPSEMMWRIFYSCLTWFKICFVIAILMPART